MSDENNDVKGLEHLLHEKAVDDTVLYAKAREFGPELFPELTLEERKQKLDSEVSSFQKKYKYLFIRNFFLLRRYLVYNMNLIYNVKFEKKWYMNVKTILLMKMKNVDFVQKYLTSMRKFKH